MEILEKSASQFLVAALIVTVMWYVWKRRSSASRLLPGTRPPPCMMSVPVIGSLPFMSLDPNKLHQYLMEQTAKYGNVFALHLGSRYAVVLNGYDSIREALVKKAVHFADRTPPFYSLQYNPNRKGVIQAQYDNKFRHYRQLYLSIMKQFGFGHRIMETRINVEVDELIKQVRIVGGKSFDPNDMLHMCVVNVITSILVGKRFKYEEPMLKELVDAVHEIFKTMVPEVELFPLLRFIQPFQKRFKSSLDAMDVLLKFVVRQIDGVMKEDNVEQDDTNNSFVKQFVRSTPTGEECDREELVMTVGDLFTAGDDTSSTTLRWILFHLANHSDVQSRLQEEVNTVVGYDRLPSLDDEVNMPYTQAFILETMRRHTLVPLSLLHRTLCDTHVASYFVPIGSTVIVNLYSAHMDPEVWEEPHSFRPERFLNEHGQVTGKERVVSFSLGKRSCLGESLAKQELFLFTIGIVQNFEVLPPDGQTEITCGTTTNLVTEPTAFQVRMVERKH